MKPIVKGVLKKAGAALAFFMVFAVSVVFADSPTYRAPRIATPEAPFSWTGLYVGGMVGYGVADAELSAPGFNFDGVSGDGWRGDAKVGIDYQLGGVPIVLRGFVCYDVGSTEATLNIGPNSASATLTPEWCVGGGVGLAFAKQTLLYGGAAWQRAKGEVTFNGTNLGSQTSDGIVYHIGLEHMLTPNLSLAAEWKMGQHEFTAGSVSIDVDEHVFGLRLNWRPTTGLFNN